MLELALAFMEASLPPEIPRIVEERQWLSALGHRAARRTMAVADGYQAMADAWIARLQRLQDSLSASAAQDAAAGDLDALTEAIERTEHFAERRAGWRRSFEKRSRRALKRTFSFDPSLAAVERAFITRLLSIDDLIIEAMLEHALFLRAIRAEFDPNARGGPTFSDPQEMQRYVEEALAR